MTTITVTKRDGTTKSVETPYTDATALDRLEGYTNNQGHRLSRSEFACDLVRKSYVGNGLSVKQAKWVHILAVEADTPRREPTPGVDLGRIKAMIDTAFESGLTRPRVTLTTSFDQTLEFKRAGDRSRNPGTVSITGGGSYGGNTYFGSISLDGRLLARDSVTDEIAAFLVEFNADPATVAAAYGIRTGVCCFCRTPISAPKSVTVGYGEICAGHWGMPYGEIAEAPSFAEVR